MPARTETVDIFRKLYTEIADVFSSDFIHVGLDEVSFGTCEKCRNLLEKKEQWEIFADYTNKLHSLICSLKKRMMMWGDHILLDKRIADHIPKDIIICDWHYAPEVEKTSIEFFTKKGFKVICTPSLIWGNQMILPSINNLTNLKNFSQIAWKYRRKGVVGLYNSVWAPYRYLQSAINYGLALSGHLFWNKGRQDEKFNVDFLKKYFGVNNPDFIHTIKILHEISPSWNFMQKSAFRTFKEIGVIEREEMGKSNELALMSEKIRRKLKKERARVKRHITEYDVLILASDIVCILRRRMVKLDGILRLYRKAKIALKRGKRKEVRKITSVILPAIRELTKEAERIHRDTVKDWNLTRYPDAKKRDKVVLTPFGLDDGLTARLGISAKILEKLLAKVRLWRSGGT